MKFMPVFVKKIIGAGFATTNTVVQLRPAPSISAPVSGTIAKAQLTVADAISQAPIGALSTVVPSESVSPLVSGSVDVGVAPGSSVSTVMKLQPPVVGEAMVESVYVNHTGSYGATTATATAVTGTNWANPTNAQGTHNGTNATHPGAISAQDAYLDFAFPTFPNKSGLTVTSAKLRYYFAQGGTALNNGNLLLYRGTAAAPDSVLVATFTGNQDSSATPYEVDLFALGFTTFASLENFGARIRGTLAAGTLTVTQNVDAVELVVTATA